MNKTVYGVAICGAGLAGLTLARHLRLEMPNSSIVVLDRLAYPLPEAAFKVGESTVYDGAHYFAQVLQLEDYFDQQHLPKLGLRYFFGDTRGEFHKRPELGLSEFPPAPKSYQIDRGKLENDLRLFNREMGIEILEHCLVQDIQLAEHPEQPHQIVYTQEDNKKTGTISARWVVDAMGRRRFLQRKLGLAKPNDPKFNAVWFRVKGRFDLSDFVPSSEQQWHDRVPDKNRYYSTNHLCGDGYWVWLIPLSTDHTSIGIVAKEDFKPFKEFHTYELAYQWLEKYEPVLASHLKGKQPIDFKKMPKYSYSSTQAFSINRWGCVGEAAVFPDPFYSPGSDLIGYGNSLLAQMIIQSLEDKLTQKRVDEANHYYLTLSDGLSCNIHNNYSHMGKGIVMATKFIWDVGSGIAVMTPQMLYSLFLDPEKNSRVGNGTTDQLERLINRMEPFFLDWSAKSLGRVSFEFIDYWKLPFMEEIRLRSLNGNKTEQELIDDIRANLELCEELAQALFLIAVEDTMPQMLAKFPEPVWLNAWAISLDPNKWEQDGLFGPKSKPRDLRRVMEPLQRVLQVPKPALALST
jgi:flavin-dependent dehydrogenase